MALYDPNEGGAGFTIPTDVYSSSSSGFDPAYNMIDKMSAWEPGKGSDKKTEFFQPAYSKVGEAFDTARTNVPGYYGKAGASLPQMYQNQLEPALQKTLNSLVGRNMLRSSVSSEALGQTGKGVAKDILNLQTGLAGQEAGAMTNLEVGRAGILSQLAGQEAAAKSGYADLMPGFMGDIGRYSESSDPFQPIQSYLNLIEQLMF